jgi:crotonobetainyl-CoA:carnitine CoA-transferase CaiB-like acyl-CoA transferase
LAGLRERDATGHGVMIDLSQTEASATLTSTALLDYQVNGRPFVGWGNVPFGSTDAPTGLFRCQGTDAWCAISVRTDEQWQDLTEAMQRPDLGSDPRFATRHGRAAHRALLDREVTQWSEQRSRDEVAAVLDPLGVPCTPMRDAHELMTNATLRKHGHFQSATHKYLGEREFQMGGIKSDHGPNLRAAAPLLGEANDYVYHQLLGMTDDEIAAFRDDNIIL